MGQDKSKQLPERKIKPNKELQQKHANKLNQYLMFIDARKRKCNQTFQDSDIDNLVNIGPQQWWQEAMSLLDEYISNTQHKQLFTAIKSALSKSPPNNYIRTFNNKCYLEYFSLLQVQLIQKKQPVKQDKQQTTVEVGKVQELLRTHFQENIPGFFKVKQSGESNQISDSTIKAQLVHQGLKLKKRNQNFIFPLVQTEINSNDHIVFDMLATYKSYLNSTYKQADFKDILMKSIMLDELKTFQAFLHKLILTLYHDLIDERIKTSSKDRQLNQIIIKSIFDHTGFHSIILSFCKEQARPQIEQIKNAINQQYHLTPIDFGISEKFAMEKEKYPYQDVITHLRLIEETKCPIEKFTQIGKLRDIICQCNDDYYQIYPHQKYSNVQKLIDSDTFLSILIYCIVKGRSYNLIAHTHLIDAVLPSNISYEFEEQSYVWITLCAALDQLKRDKQTEFDACIQSVLKEKLADSMVR